MRYIGQSPLSQRGLRKKGTLLALQVSVAWIDIRYIGHLPLSQKGLWKKGTLLALQVSWREKDT
jgi:hypothetical protein